MYTYFSAISQTQFKSEYFLYYCSKTANETFEEIFSIKFEGLVWFQESFSRSGHLFQQFWQTPFKYFLYRCSKTANECRKTNFPYIWRIIWFQKKCARKISLVSTELWLDSKISLYSKSCFSMCDGNRIGSEKRMGNHYHVIYFHNDMLINIIFKALLTSYNVWYQINRL